MEDEGRFRSHVEQQVDYAHGWYEAVFLAAYLIIWYSMDAL